LSSTCNKKPPNRWPEAKRRKGVDGASNPRKKGGFYYIALSRGTVPKGLCRGYAAERGQEHREVRTDMKDRERAIGPLLKIA